MMNVVLFSNDLMVASRVEGAAARAGVSAKTVASIDALVSRHQESQAAMLIVDLSTPSLDVAQLVTRIKAIGESPPEIVAFGPHVHESLLSAARAAGCDEVISRGQFFAQIEAILSRAAANQGEPGGG